MNHTYKIIKKTNDFQIKEIESGNWWSLSSLKRGEEYFIDELLNLDIELSDEKFKDYIRSFNEALNYVKNNHSELML